MNTRELFVIDLENLKNLSDGKEERFREAVKEWFELNDKDIRGITILHAAYDNIGDYNGESFVLFEKDGKLFEVNASHCSCDELQGQWEPEETSIEALRFRKDAALKDLKESLKRSEEAAEKRAKFMKKEDVKQLKEEINELKGDAGIFNQYISDVGELIDSMQSKQGGIFERLQSFGLKIDLLEDRMRDMERHLHRYTSVESEIPQAGGQ